MKLTMIALGAGAGCLLLAGSALAGPCTAQIDDLQKQLQSTDAGMGPTGTTAGAKATAGAGTTTNMDQTSANAVSPSGQPQVPTTPATGTMNDASQNKATSAQDVQNQNTGQGTMADQASGAGSAVPGTSAAAQSLQRAQQLDQAGDAVGCKQEIDRAQNLMQTQ